MTVYKQNQCTNGNNLVISRMLSNRSTARTVKCNQYDLNDSLQAEPVYKWK